MGYKIKLGRGCAVDISGLTDEQYHQVWKRIIDDGDDGLWYNPLRRKSGVYLEHHGGSFLHADYLEISTHHIYTYEEIMEKENMFTKSDLKTGMVIKFRNDKTAMVLRGTKGGDIYSGEVWGDFRTINEDLTVSDLLPEWDIGEVWQPDSNQRYLHHGIDIDSCTLVWKREEKSEHDILFENIQKEVEQAQVVLKQAQDKLNGLLSK